MLRGTLAAAEVPYSWAVRWRNRRFDSGATTVYRVKVPVISVGNLTLGGTGKTPMVEWIVRLYREQGKQVGILSRGYAGRNGPNDEALELEWKLPGVPHLQGADRVATARRAIREYGCQVLVLDDAFQHRRLGRDLDIVLLDALEPLGYERVFPRGMLREPVQELARADVIALSRADLLTADQRSAIQNRVMKLSPTAVWIEIVHAPLGLVRAEGTSAKLPSTSRSGKGSIEQTPAFGGKTGKIEIPITAQPGREGVGNMQPLDTLQGRRVLAFCGVGNPAGFRHTLEVCGYEVVEFHEFPDHHVYTPGDLRALEAASEHAGAEVLLCTQKDLVKIGTARLVDRPLWAIRVGIDFLAGREELEQELPVV